MATKLYFHLATNSTSGLPTSEQSSMSAVASVEAQSINRTMNTTIGTSQTSIAYNNINSGDGERIYWTKFVSPALDMSSISANTWTYNFAGKQSNASADFPCNRPDEPFNEIDVNLYVWRPSTQTKIGTIKDDNVTTVVDYSDETSTNETCYHVTFSGSSVSSLSAGDVLILEVWHLVSSSSGTHTGTVYFDGTTESTSHLSTVSNHASYLETPQTLTFQAGGGDTTPPTVDSVSPVDNATNVSVNSNIVVTFSEAMSSASINTTNIKVNDGTTDIAGTVSLGGAGNNVATFDPTNALNFSHVYTITVTTGVEDVALNNLASQFVSDFTTQASGGGGGGGTGNTKAKKLTFLKPTSTSTPVAQSISGVGFTPKAAWFYAVPVTSNNVYSGGASKSYGFSDGVDDACIAQAQEDAVTTSDTAGVIRNDSCICILDPTNPSTILARASVSAWTSDGANLSWAVNNNQAYIIHAFFIGGSDITNVKVRHETVTTTDPGNQSYTGVGFPGDFVNFIGVDKTSVYNTVNINSQFVIGSARSTSKRWVAAGYSQSAQGTSDTYHVYQNDKCLTNFDTGTGDIKMEADFVSFNADGITLNYSGADVDDAAPFSFIVVKGGLWDVGDFAANNTTNNQTITLAAGIAPVGAMFFSTKSTVADTGSTVAAAHNSIMIGAADANLDQGLIFTDDRAGEGEMINAMISKTDAVIRTATAAASHASTTLDGEADIFNMSTTSQIELDWTDATNQRFAWFALGQEPAVLRQVSDTVPISDSVTRVFIPGAVRREVQDTVLLSDFVSATKIIGGQTLHRIHDIVPVSEELQVKYFPKPPPIDRFGLAFLYPTKPGGWFWESNWEDIAPLSVNLATIVGDSEPITSDQNFHVHEGAVGTLNFDGDGHLTITDNSTTAGVQLRVYDKTNKNAVDPLSTGLRWGPNIELTVYVNHVEGDPGNEFEGSFSIRLGSDHHFNTTCPYNSHEYVLVVLRNGGLYISNESYHGMGGSARPNINWGIKPTDHKIWWKGFGGSLDGTLPTNAKIGWKFVKKQAGYSGEDIILEVWRDLYDGNSGGQWEKITEFCHRQGNWFDEEKKALFDASIINSGSCLIIPTHPDQTHNHSGGMCYLRLGIYKKTIIEQFSIREINPIFVSPATAGISSSAVEVSPDIQWFYSGGSTNADPSKSIGGQISNRRVPSDILHNLFDPVTEVQAARGADGLANPHNPYHDIRCIYCKNTSFDKIIKNAKISFAQSDNITSMALSGIGLNGVEPLLLSETDELFGVTPPPGTDPQLVQVYSRGLGTVAQAVGPNDLSAFRGTRVAHYVLNTASEAFGKVIVAASFLIDKVGSPTGTATCKVWDKGDAVKATLGTVDVATLTDTFTVPGDQPSQEIVFGGDPNFEYTAITFDDKIGIEYTGGDASNYIRLGAHAGVAEGQAMQFHSFINSEWQATNNAGSGRMWIAVLAPPPPAPPPPPGPGPGPSPPPPGPPGGSGLGPYPAIGSQINCDIDDEAGTRHYASGKPDDRTIEANGDGIDFDHYQFVVDVTMKDVEHDDNVSVKYGGTHMGTGWLDSGVSFEDGECCLGVEEDHPSTDLCVITGERIGNILNKDLKVAAVYSRQSNCTELWTNLQGGGWFKRASGCDVNGFNPGSDNDEVQLRIDGFASGGSGPGEGNVPEIRSAFVTEIADPQISAASAVPFAFGPPRQIVVFNRAIGTRASRIYPDPAGVWAPIWAHYVENAGTPIINQVIIKASFFFDKVGDPQGQAFCRVWDANNNVKATLGEVDVSTIVQANNDPPPGDPVTEVTFGGNVDLTYSPISVKDKIGIEYQDGNETNYIRVNVFDPNENPDIILPGGSLVVARRNVGSNSWFLGDNVMAGTLWAGIPPCFAGQPGPGPGPGPPGQIDPPTAPGQFVKEELSLGANFAPGQHIGIWLRRRIPLNTRHADKVSHAVTISGSDGVDPSPIPEPPPGPPGGPPELELIFDEPAGDLAHRLWSGPDDTWGPRAAHTITGSGAEPLGRIIAKASFFFDKVGDPTGDVFCRIWNSNDGVKATLGAADVSTIVQSDPAPPPGEPVTEVTFGGNVNINYPPIAIGDRIGLEYTGGDVDNYIRVSSHSNQAGDMMFVGFQGDPPFWRTGTNGGAGKLWALTPTSGPGPPPPPPPNTGDKDQNGIIYLFGVPSGGTESFDFDANFRSDGKRFDFNILGQPGVEVGAYFHINNDPNDEVSGKMYGGPHNDSASEESRTYDIGIDTGGSNVRLRQEWSHPDYTDNLESENINLGNFEGRWVGFRFCVFNTDNNTHVRMVVLVDNDGLDSSGRPINNWQVIADWEDTGQYPHGPGTTYEFDNPQQTIRVDGVGGDGDMEWYGVFCRHVDTSRPMTSLISGL